MNTLKAPNFFIRMFAYILDYLIWFGIPFVLLYIYYEPLLLEIKKYILSQSYRTLYWMWPICTHSLITLVNAPLYRFKGGSLGKVILNIKVTNENGGYLSYYHLFCREVIGKIISTELFFIGYLISIFRKDRRALHDLIFKTYITTSDTKTPDEKYYLKLSIPLISTILLIAAMQVKYDYYKKSPTTFIGRLLKLSVITPDRERIKNELDQQIKTEATSHEKIVVENKLAIVDSTMDTEQENEQRRKDEAEFLKNQLEIKKVKDQLDTEKAQKRLRESSLSGANPTEIPIEIWNKREIQELLFNNYPLKIRYYPVGVQYYDDIVEKFIKENYGAENYFNSLQLSHGNIKRLINKYQGQRSKDDYIKYRETIIAKFQPLSCCGPNFSSAVSDIMNLATEDLKQDPLFLEGIFIIFSSRDSGSLSLFWKEEKERFKFTKPLQQVLLKYKKHMTFLKNEMVPEELKSNIDFMREWQKND